MPLSFQGPHRNVRASEFMIFVYLDEFGHIGPFHSRTAPKHNESPVFGLAGLVLPEKSVRAFSSFFLEQKKFYFSAEIINSRTIAAKWEKKGTSFIRPKPIQEYSSLRRLLIRILNKISDLEGNIFYYGREKIMGATDLNAIGFYKTCLSHSLRSVDGYCNAKRENFVVIVDQHSARKELLECAAKTMYGERPCRHLASPPFEVESYLNQNIQAADWIATLMGRLLARQVLPDQYEDNIQIENIFKAKIEALQIASILERRSIRSRSKINSTQHNKDSPFYTLKNMLDN